MSDFQTQTLHRISELPFDAEAEMFRRYPGFKLGVAECVNFYARLMLPLVKQVITNNREHSGWMLTAPAITAQTPAAATCCVASCLTCTCKSDTRPLSKRSP